MEANKGIFISYRRDETAAYAGWLADKLDDHFGKQNVFRDIGSIEPGTDFVEAIERALEATAVMLVVIGKSWQAKLEETRRTGQQDYSRLEVATALKRNVRVIPVLVQGASIPRADELPTDLAPLARRNAIEMHDTNWESDIQYLVAVLKKAVGSDVEETRTWRRYSEQHRGVLRKNLIAAVVLGALAFIGLLAVIFLRLSSPTVPDVVGQTQSEAERSGGDDYKIDVDEVRVDDKPKGTIIEQNPEPGEPAEQGLPISVIVSAGQPPDPGDIFRDDFSSTNSGWPQGEFYKNTKWYYVADYFHGVYRIYNAPSDPPFGSSAGVLNTSIGSQEDVTVEVDAQVTGDAPHGSDDEWGIICRAQDQGNYYLLWVGPGGNSGISKINGQEVQPLAYGGKSDDIRGGTEKNHLRADCLGNKLTLFVNGHKVVEDEDATIDSGFPGLYVQDTGDEKLEILFDNFLVSSP